MQLPEGTDCWEYGLLGVETAVLVLCPCLNRVQSAGLGRPLQFWTEWVPCCSPPHLGTATFGDRAGNNWRCCLPFSLLVAFLWFAALQIFRNDLEICEGQKTWPGWSWHPTPRAAVFFRAVPIAWTCSFLSTTQCSTLPPAPSHSSPLSVSLGYLF